MSLRRDLKRIIGEGKRSVLRNSFVSFSSIFITTVSLLLISLVILFYGALDITLSHIEKRVDMNVYFIPETPQKEIENLALAVKAIPEVEKVTIVSKQDALKDFLGRYKGDELIRRSIDEIGENPLGAYLTIKAKNPKSYESIMQALENDSEHFVNSPYIEYINYKDNAYIIKRLNTFSSIAKKISYTIIIFLALIAVVVVMNMMNVSMYAFKDEITAKRLVGAENRYITGPFAVAGIFYGAIAGIIVILLLMPVSYYASKFTETFFGDMSIYQYFMENIIPFGILILSLGILLTYIASFLSVRKFLKV